MRGLPALGVKVWWCDECDAWHTEDPDTRVVYRKDPDYKVSDISSSAWTYYTDEDQPTCLWVECPDGRSTVIEEVDWTPDWYSAWECHECNYYHGSKAEADDCCN